MSIGKFVWYDVMTTDTKAATAFYSAVVGWTIKDSGMEGSPYSILWDGDKMVGGLMPIPEDAAAMGARPAWMGYIGVDDVDAHVGKVTAAGGKVFRPGTDIPGVGRFAVVADPHGAAFILFKSSNSDAAPTHEPFAPGYIGWHELHAGNGDEAFAFYSKLFGWTKTDAMDMGPMGMYQIFSTGGEMGGGGIMTKSPETPVPHWLYYFNVTNIDAAAERVTKAGGKIVNGPMQVPGDMWIINAFDPQGAMFALLGSRK